MSIGPYQGQSGKFGGGKVYNEQNYTPEQMELYRKYAGMQGPGQQHMARMAEGSEEDWEALEAPAMRQFGAFQGANASRFSGMGGLGARKSSGFQNDMSSASQSMAEQLQSNRLGLQRQATNDLWSMNNDILNKRPFTQSRMEPKRGGMENFMTEMLPMLMKILPFLL